MKTQKDKNSQPKSNKLFYTFVVLGACVLSYIINKDIDIPSWMTISLGVFIAFFLFFYGSKKPEFAFYALVAYLPFNKIFSGSFGGFMTAVNMTNILIFIVIFCWFVHRASHGKILFEKNGLNWLILIFCLLGIFSVFRGGLYYGSKYIMEFIVPLKRWLTPVMLYYISLNLIKDKQVMRTTAIIMMIVVGVAGLLAIKEGIDLGGGSLDKSRVGGLAQQPNMMGAFFVYYMFLFLGFFLLNWRKLKSWWLLMPFLICLRGIQVTYSRGALMAFAFGLAGITFFKNKLLFLLLCFGVVVALLNPQWLPGSFRYAIDRTSSNTDQIYSEGVALENRVDRSAGLRIEIWKGAAEMIKDNPMWGVGYGVFPYAIPMYVSGIGERDAHNTYLIIAAEMGIPVLIVFLLIILVIFKNTFWLFTRVKDPFVKALALGMLGGLSGLLVANMFGSRLESEEVSAYLWILTGMIVRAVIMKKRGEIA